MEAPTPNAGSRWALPLAIGAISAFSHSAEKKDVYIAAYGGATAHRAIRPVMAALARWDAATADRVDRFLANSQHVAGRIARYYNRKADVVYPPVDTDFFVPDAGPPERFFLVVSALVPYKRIELAIEACQAIGAPLKVVGEGPELARLR